MILSAWPHDVKTVQCLPGVLWWTRKAVTSIDACRVAVKGHNMFWGFTKNLPDWVPHLSVSQLNKTVYDRLHYLVNITKGQLVQRRCVYVCVCARARACVCVRARACVRACGCGCGCMSVLSLIHI